MRYLAGTRAERENVADGFDSELEPFVSNINELVLAMERSYADDTNLLRSVQAALVLLAILGTAIDRSHQAGTGLARPAWSAPSGGRRQTAGGGHAHMMLRCSVPADRSRLRARLLCSLIDLRGVA